MKRAFTKLIPRDSTTFLNTPLATPRIQIRLDVKERIIAVWVRLDPMVAIARGDYLVQMSIEINRINRFNLKVGAAIGPGRDAVTLTCHGPIEFPYPGHVENRIVHTDLFIAEPL